jgi:hypothetical protein
VALTIACATFVSAQIDPRQMAGIPRPVDDLPTGSVSVRLIRGQLANNISGHPIDLQVDDKVVTVKTDEGGRAQFDKLRPGATLKAVAIVDGERLESQTFRAPAQGGIRVMLVATDSSRAEAAAPAPAAVPGQIVLGGETRIVIEGADEALEVYYLLDIENRAAEPVIPAAPFAFEMPAVGSLLNGSSKLAVVEGRRVQVNGPFPPGRTLVQVAYRLPVTTISSRRFRRRSSAW